MKDIWALRVRLQMEGRVRELALFNLGIDSKLRGCDLVALKVRDVTHGDQVATRAIVMQHKTKRPVQFEITGVTREALQAWIKKAELKSSVLKYSFQAWESLPAPKVSWLASVVHRVDRIRAAQERACAPARCRHKKAACKKVMPFRAIMRSSQRML